MTQIDSSVATLANQMIECGKNDAKLEKLYTKFKKLNIPQIVALIDYIIDDSDNIKVINSLIRVRETAKVVLDHKILFLALKKCVLAY